MKTISYARACVAGVYLWLDTLTAEEVAYLIDWFGGVPCVELCALAGASPQGVPNA